MAAAASSGMISWSFERGRLLRSSFEGVFKSVVEMVVVSWVNLGAVYRYALFF